MQNLVEAQQAHEHTIAQQSQQQAAQAAQQKAQLASQEKQNQAGLDAAGVKQPGVKGMGKNSRLVRRVHADRTG